MKLRLAFFVLLLGAAAAQTISDALEWRQLNPLPDHEGFAGSYAGTSNGALLVAGGANFAGQRPWTGGVKTWYDSVFVLESPDGVWKAAGRLPRPGGYGLSLTVKEGLLLIGGGDAGKNFRDVLLARWDGRQLSYETLPALPTGLAMQAGAVLGRTVYVAGGLDRPDATEAQKIFLRLDLDRPAAGWSQLEPWPGTERFLATGGALDGSFFLFGGVRLLPGPDGRPQRQWLKDAWRYTPGSGWKRLADLPKPLAASPGPAPALGFSRLLLLGGDDGSLVSRPPQNHPGFPREAWAYDASADSWVKMNPLPFSLVTTPVTIWQDQFIIPGGESRPGVRSPAIWSGSLAR